jgi:hypothetical protein
MAYARTLPPEDVLHVHDHMLLANATRETQRWCAFLGVDCPPRYSAAVARILFRSPWQLAQSHSVVQHRQAAHCALHSRPRAAAHVLVSTASEF